MTSSTGCIEPGCTVTSTDCLRRSMCRVHYEYKRYRKQLKPLPKPSIEERVFSKILVSETGCLLWTASTNSSGYGHFSVSGEWFAAHRFIYERVRGPIPDGMQLDHLCRVRNCVNPRHLEVVDSRTNQMRGMSPLAENARKTHCIHGHPFDLLNTYITKQGHRQCRICTRIKNRKSALAAAEAMNANSSQLASGTNPNQVGALRTEPTVPAKENTDG